MATPAHPLVRAVKDKGFALTDRPLFFDKDARLTSTTRTDLWFTGSVQTARGPASLYLNVLDLSFVEQPQVLLRERPPWLVGWRPHLISLGPNKPESLCYSNHEKYQLLAHDPAMAILRVLKDASDTLDRIAEPESTKEDSQRELAQLWNLDALFTNVFIDVEPAKGEQTCPTAIVKIGKSEAFLVSRDIKLLASKLGISGELTKGPAAVIYPESSAPLYLTAKGLPSDIRQIRQWLKDISTETFDRWQKQVQSPDYYRDEIRAHLFRTRGQVIGYLMDPVPAMRKVKSARQIREFIRKHVHEKPVSITRLAAHRIDEDYLIRRNLREGVEDLRGMKILLVGCGAIGGYLAQSIVQLGAGIDSSTSKGNLFLCDNDVLSEANIGRHLLGFRQLRLPKSIALQKHLSELRPTASVTAERCRFHDIENRLHEFDLIIDAGGYEILARHMSKLLRQKKWFQRGKALLNVWIEGQGGVFRCLMQDSSSAACFDCLWNYGATSTPAQRDKAYTDPKWTEMAEDGYASMTPFAVSAPQSAAALAVDAILDWKAGNSSPRFRSRSAEGKGIKPSFSKDVVRAKACPGCSD